MSKHDEAMNALRLGDDVRIASALGHDANLCMSPEKTPGRVDARDRAIEREKQEKDFLHRKKLLSRWLPKRRS